MSDAYLTTYLNDHLGASVAGIELARRCLSKNAKSDLATFLEELLLVLEENQVKIRKLLRRLNAGESELKKLGGWALEKVGRLKLNNSLLGYTSLARVIELEALLAGLKAQSAMWSALQKYRSDDERFAGIDFDRSKRLSEEMLERIEGYHSRAAEKAFAVRNISEQV